MMDLILTGVIALTGLVLSIYGLTNTTTRPALLFGLIMILLSVDDFLVYNYGLEYWIHCLLRCTSFLLGIVLVYDLVIKRTSRVKYLENRLRKLEELKKFARSEYESGAISEEDYKKITIKYDEEIVKILMEIKEIKPVKIPLLEEISNMIFR